MSAKLAGADESVQLTAWLPGPLVSGRPTIGGGAWRTADETTPYGLHDRDVGFVEVPAEPERHRNDEGRHAAVTVAMVHLKNVRVRCGASRKGVKQCPTRPYSAIAAAMGGSLRPPGYCLCRAERADLYAPGAWRGR